MVMFTGLRFFTRVGVLPCLRALGGDPPTHASGFSVTWMYQGDPPTRNFYVTFRGTPTSKNVAGGRTAAWTYQIWYL